MSNYRPLCEIERKKIANQVKERFGWLEARNPDVVAQHFEMFVQYYEWHGKNENCPAHDVFVRDIRRSIEIVDIKDPNEKLASERSPDEVMQKLNEIADSTPLSKYQFFYGEHLNEKPYLIAARLRFFNSRTYRTEMLSEYLKVGKIINVDDAEEVKKACELEAFETRLITEEVAYPIRMRPIKAFS